MQDANFSFYEVEKGRWMLPQGVCCVCGCDTDFLEFTSEDEESIAAFQLTEEGKEVEMRNACPVCYDKFF
ncbi:hypothetical protein D3C74_488480 [compost metagenome]